MRPSIRPSASTRAPGSEAVVLIARWRGDDLETSEVVMGHLALGERFGDHSDDFTADLESSVGHHTHQAHVPAAIDEANPLLAKVAAEFGSRGGERRVSAGARSAVHGDGVKLNGGHGCRRYRRGTSLGRLSSAISRRLRYNGVTNRRRSCLSADCNTHGRDPFPHS